MPPVGAPLATALAASLLLVGLTPAPAAATGGSAPVTVVALTSGDGSLTALADDGLDEVPDRPEEAPAPQTTTARRLSAPSSAQDGTSADTPSGEPADAAPVAVLTAPIETETFYVAGVTWDGQDAMPADAVVSIRVLENGGWTDWEHLEVEHNADTPSPTGGTEPYIAAGAEAVQVQVTGDSEQLPANLRLTLTPEWPGEEERVISSDAPPAPVAPTGHPVAPAPQPATPTSLQQTRATASAPESARAAAVAAAAVPRPTIVSRAGWGADESLMRWQPKDVELRAAVVHHTAGTNSYTQAQSPSIVRGIYHYHAVSRGWGDIGYNFLVDKWGRIYEGRRGSLAAPAGKMPVGAHAAPFNTGTVGLSVMGDYSAVAAPQAAMDALADIIAWQFGRAGLDPTGSSGMTSPGTASRPRGQNLPRVFGHRDVTATVCPGLDIYQRLGALARSAQQRIRDASGPSSPAPQPPTDPVDHTSRVFLNNGWGPYSDVDYAFGNARYEVYVGDWDGDGVDTLALRDGNTFYVYDRHATGAPDHVIRYGRAGDEILVGDWDGDGVDTFAVRRGKTFHVKNSVTGGDADVVFVYGRAGDTVLVGDWDGDGRDTFTVRRGTTYHVKNSVTGGPADLAIIYGRSGDRVLVGDWDGDGIDTFAVRRGFTYHVKNRILGGDADVVLNYGRKDDVVLVGDWDGDGTDTLGVHRH
ncbi:N-acetylmuramoyl-L-alanine amidase [uncultured Georgenia sp.]|uniref:N-acetylmuramoyl-L-alanine amidase n=1 Tax=uncultured Georgenia sp. TaxID=378209 RepID=UPI002607EACB|nr:N-acetylmuramoyl-L-alanine amidase [uncultured Georgenia sp.]HLV05790.1 N-acetylmuramoyl-L-alanine amidase [Actinomycetaceae bacterium]